MHRTTVRFSLTRPGMTDGPRSRSARPAPVRLHHHVPHHLSELHHRAVGVHRDAAAALDRHRPRASAPAGAVLDQDLRGLVRHGRRLGHRPVLPVRHQLEPLLGRRRQRGRPADRLRGADRVLPRGDVPRRHAVRLEARAAVAARAVGDLRRGRHRALGVLDPLRQSAGCRRRPATRCATASPIRSTGSRSSSIRASPIASRTC